MGSSGRPRAPWRPSRGFAILLGGVAIVDLGVASFGYGMMGAGGSWDDPFRNPLRSDNPNLIPFVLFCVLACACTAAYSIHRGAGEWGPLLMIGTHLGILVSFVVGVACFPLGHEEGIAFLLLGGPLTLLLCILGFATSGWALRRRIAR